MKWKHCVVLIFCILSFILGSFFRTRDRPSAASLPSALAIDLPKSVEEQSTVAENAVDAVVNISSIKIVQYQPLSPFMNDPFFKHFFGEDFSPFGQPREYRSKSLGSGVLVTLEGHILTNNHVVENADEILVRTNNQLETTAKIIGKDPQTDLALLKISPPKNMRALSMGNSDALRLAEPVLAIGSPFGLGGTVTMGIVSAKGRANVGIVDYEDFIQTDAAINPGNSGGALINLKGELVGINTAIFSKSGGYQGIGFAIPINMAKHVMDQLILHGKVERGWIGIRYQEITQELARALGRTKMDGAIVTAVYPRGPGDEAGIQRGDIVLEFNKTPVRSPGHLSKLLSETPLNKKVTLSVLRGKMTLELNVYVRGVPTDLRRN